jgi:hypothetical protein
MKHFISLKFGSDIWRKGRGYSAQVTYCSAFFCVHNTVKCQYNEIVQVTKLYVL